MSLPLALFDGLCLWLLIFSVNEAFVNRKNRPQAWEYAAKWLGILSPLWLFTLFLVYCIVAAECTTGGFDPAQEYFAW